jgi:hypothetical protein
MPGAMGSPAICDDRHPRRAMVVKPRALLQRQR